MSGSERSGIRVGVSGEVFLLLAAEGNSHVARVLWVSHSLCLPVEISGDWEIGKVYGGRC